MTVVTKIKLKATVIAMTASSKKPILLCNASSAQYSVKKSRMYPDKVTATSLTVSCLFLACDSNG